MGFPEVKTAGSPLPTKEIFINSGGRELTKGIYVNQKIDVYCHSHPLQNRQETLLDLVLLIK